MKAIYEPKGRAREYAELALNLHLGCPHQCGYCYVSKLRGTQAPTITVRPGILEQVRKDAAEMARAGDQREVVLSFLSDPYPYRHPCPHTREALEILLGHGLRVAILSKGGMYSMADLDLLKAHKSQVRVGASLTCWSEELRQRWEPGAAPVVERIEALDIAKCWGIATFASCEPILDCQQTALAIGVSAGSVDEYRIGWINYSQVKPNPQELPAVIAEAKLYGRVALKRDAWNVLARIGRLDAAEGCDLLFEVGA